MKVLIRKIGSLRGIIIPNRFLTKVGLNDDAELSIENNSIVLRKPKGLPRAGWTQAGKKIAAIDDDVLVWPEFCDKDDKSFQW